MIIVDEALRRREREGQPLRVGIIGAGFMGRGIAYQIQTAVPGMRLAAVSSRNAEAAERAYREAGTHDFVRVTSREALESAIAEGRPVVTQDGLLVAAADGLDVVIEATGDVEFGAHVALACFDARRHLASLNAEMSGTIGPILKRRADAAGVVYTDCDGDQPAVTMNLYRFVRGIGVRPILCGNIKGLHDPYRNPTTQVEFARRWGQKPQMVASFADGTKVSFEQATIANATGMGVAKRGMYGLDTPGLHIAEAAQRFPLDEIAAGPGIVDYVVGAAPAPGVFVIGEHLDPFQQHYLRLYKLGDGPYYCFYTPYHLCHFEAPLTAARAALFGDAAIAPLAGPCVDVVAAAKTDLDTGTVIDGFGGYATYGLCENTATAAEQGLLPIGIAEGARLRRAVARDRVLTYDDVELAPDRLAQALRREQDGFDWAGVAGREGAGAAARVHA